MFFKYVKIETLYEVAIAIKKGIYNNPLVFLSPPMLEADFLAIIENYKSKRTAYKNGGKDQKGEYLTAYDLLITALVDYGVYVDKYALGNESIITLGGYIPTKTSKSDKPLPATPLPELKSNGTGSLVSDCVAVPTASMYGAVLSNVELPNMVVDENGLLKINEVEPFANMAVQMNFSSPRKKTWIGLTSGKLYYVYYFAVNSTGSSLISDPASLLCF